MRKAFAMVVAAAALCLANVVATAPGAHAEGSTQLHNLGTGLCLGIAGSSAANGARAVQGDCHGTATQEWIGTGRSFNADGGTYFQWVNGVNKCLGVTNASTASGAQLVQGECVTGATGTDRSQYWIQLFVTAEESAFFNSWSRMCIGIHNGTQGGPGANVVQGPCGTPDDYTPTSTQLWFLD